MRPIKTDPDYNSNSRIAPLRVIQRSDLQGVEYALWIWMTSLIHVSQRNGYRVVEIEFNELRNETGIKYNKERFNNILRNIQGNDLAGGLIKDKVSILLNFERFEYKKWGGAKFSLKAMQDYSNKPTIFKLYMELLRITNKNARINNIYSHSNYHRRWIRINELSQSIASELGKTKSRSLIATIRNGIKQINQDKHLKISFDSKNKSIFIDN